MIVRGWWERVQGPLHNSEEGSISGDEGREGGHPLNLLKPDARNSRHHTITSNTEQIKLQVLTNQAKHKKHQKRINTA